MADEVLISTRSGRNEKQIDIDEFGSVLEDFFFNSTVEAWGKMKFRSK